MNYKKLTGKSIRDAFNDFDKQHPEVYYHFKRLSLKAINLGKSKFSAKLVLNTIRWEIFIQADKEIIFDSKGNPISVKINDAFGSYYARKFADEFPMYKDKLEFRKLRNEDNLSTFPVTP